MKIMYSWGASNITRFFYKKTTNSTPTKLCCFSKTEVQKICIGKSLAIILLKDGSVHSFGDENDILGHASNSSKVSTLETIHVSDVSAGGGHLFAIDESGKVYGWGLNSHQQLGWKESNSYSIPKLLKPIQSHKISMVACGEAHSLFLGVNGAVWSAGNNGFGQLGLGNNAPPSSEARQITTLQGIPFMQVAAGYSHSFAVTVSGTVFCWGKNDCGQLGLGDTTHKNSPTLLKSLRTQGVRYIAAGMCHTAILTSNGGVFTFGSNEEGQLGHGYSPASNSQISAVPKQVFELMGNTITQVACGSFHTLAFAYEAGQIYVFGSNQQRQLGYISENKKEEFLPYGLSGPWFSRKAEPQISGTSFSGMDHSGIESNVFIREIHAGGFESLVLTAVEKNAASDFRNMPSQRRLLALNDDLISKLENLDSNARINTDLGKYIETVISSSACLNASFLETDHSKTSHHYHGISLMAARLAFSKIASCSCNDVNDVIAYHLQASLIPSLPDSPPDIEALRLYVFLPECKLFANPDYFMPLTIPFARKFTTLTSGASKVLDNWFATLEPNYFYHQVNMYKNCLEYILEKLKLNNTAELQNCAFVNLQVLKKLNHVNSMGERFLIPFQKFYVPEISNLINLDDDYLSWARGNTRNVVICNYPFLLNAIAKSSLLQIDATWQMRAAFSQAQDRNIASLFGMGNAMETPVLELSVRRDELVRDALSKLAEVDMRSLKKPLVIQFEGEEGQDAGGVRKEFFMLILKEVVDPKYGMFSYFEDSRLIWFSDYELETDMMYFLVGLLCGLAIYNSTIIDICFPLALYKKLLGEVVNLSDLQELDPVVWRGLVELLQFSETESGSIEDVFSLNFTVNAENFGETRTIELKPNGKNIAVSKDNCKEYIDLYLDYLFNKSVSHQFEAFSKGFHKVCGGRILELFRSTELMEMVVGNQNYNWEDFEKQASYKGEYYRNHLTIKLFWEVFHEFSLDDKKEFLLFLTGCNKVPINGVKITIQPMKSSENYLPVAHTCFNLLDLPLYQSKETLKNKLLQAMLNNQGFHLV